jgi:DNA-binding MarR family transcriptional regulator
MTRPIARDEIALPALLRAAREAYSAAVREGLADAGFNDVPKNGSYVMAAIGGTSAPLATIIRGLGASKQAAGQLVDTLVSRGYLERMVDENDRRRLTVALSARGRAAAAIVRKAAQSVDAKLLKRAGPQAVEHARSALFVLIAIANEGRPS